MSDPGERVPLQWTEVWQQDDGEWRWRYVADPGPDGDRVELPANEPESTRAQAEEAARTAYPDLGVQVLAEAPEPGRPGRPGTPQRLREAMTAAVIAAVLVLVHPRRWTAGTAVVTALAAARRYRRAGRS